MTKMMVAWLRARGHLVSTRPFTFNPPSKETIEELRKGLEESQMERDFLKAEYDHLIEKEEDGPLDPDDTFRLGQLNGALDILDMFMPTLETIVEYQDYMSKLED